MTISTPCVPGPKRILLNGCAPSARLLRACCRFGIGVSAPATEPAMTRELGALLRLAPGQTAFITGPSGCGKSRLLKRLHTEVEGATLCDLSSIYRSGRAHAAHPPSAPRRARSVIDLIPLPLDRALRLLASCGLADPFVLGRTTAELSVGERARFALARALAKQRSGWLLIDEFLTTLDRETAAGVARSFRRAAQEFTPHCRIVVATAHEDVGFHFGADVHVRCVGAAPVAEAEGSPLKRAGKQKAKTGKRLCPRTAAEAAA